MIFPDPVEAVRIGFVLAAASVLLVFLIPATRDRFLAYGARSAGQDAPSAKKQSQSRKVSEHWLNALLDAAATWQVPHNWFISFYLISVALSLLWIVFLPIYRSHLPQFLESRPSSTPFSRQTLASLLMLTQGLRRLAECKLLATPSKSTMWVGHWAMGIGFYAAMSVAIWIEGLPDIISHKFSVRDVQIQPPSLRAFIGLLLFTFASGIQHDCHAYLASLKKPMTNTKGNVVQTPSYQIPSHPAFSTTLTPHYFAECIIYLALSIVAAPTGELLNKTLLCALLFVIVNLGITAKGTYAWYAETFGVKAVHGRWAMIPFVF